MHSQVLNDPTFKIRDAWDRQEWNNAIGKKAKNKKKKQKLEDKGKQIELLAQEERDKAEKRKAATAKLLQAQTKSTDSLGLSKNAKIGFGVAAVALVLGVITIFKIKKQNP